MFRYKDRKFSIRGHMYSCFPVWNNLLVEVPLTSFSFSSPPNPHSVHSYKLLPLCSGHPPPCLPGSYSLWRCYADSSRKNTVLPL